MLQRSEDGGKWKEELDHTGAPGLSIVLSSSIPAAFLQQGTAPTAVKDKVSGWYWVSSPSSTRS